MPASFEESVRATFTDLCPPQTGVDVLFQSAATVQALIPSQRTTTDLLWETLEPLKRLLEQTSAQVVESQQLAIAERSQRRAVAQDAQSQIEELRKQLEAIETAQQASLWTRLRRRFK
jgi:DNA repair exonuclease SbcCD ATPase subunit